jgi:DNA-binding MarR family transcriptional regulator
VNERNLAGGGRRAAPIQADPAAGERTPRGGERSGTRFVDNYLGYLLGQANHALYKDFDTQVRAAGLTSIEWRVLATLHDSEPLTVSQLAQEVLSKQPTVTKLVKRMVEQDWLALQADPADQRRTLVVATVSGRRLVKPLVQQAKAHEARTLRLLGAAERQALRRLLEKLRQPA